MKSTISYHKRHHLPQSIFLIVLLLMTGSLNPVKAQSGCIPPPDMVVSCKYWFDISDLDVPSNPTFGRVVSTFAQRHKITTRDIVCPGFCQNDRYNAYFPARVQDGLPCDYYHEYYNPTHPDRKYNLSWGWDGVYESGMVQIEVNDLRDCGIGRIVRTFKILSGSDWIPVAHQTIWVINCDPFYINPRLCNDNTDDIEWPLGCSDPAVLTECDPDISPDNPLLGKPKFANGAGRYCSMVSMDYSDKRFTVEGDGCFKIIRTWTVVDWCQYHPEFDARKGKWTYRQIIKVVNKTDPVVAWDSINLNLRDSVLPDGTCANLAILKIQASDDCTTKEHLRYEYKVDLYNDGKGEHGTYDYYAGHLDKPGLTTVRHDNPYALDPTDVLDASGYYPLGKHKISWFVEDGCGNVAVLDSVIEVRDTKAPTPYCKSGLVTVIMPSSGSVGVSVDRLNIGAFDNCTAREDLKIYFNGAPTLKTLVITCDSFAVGAHQLDVPAEVWVEDAAGNTDYCTLTLQVQDPNGACDDTSGLRLSFVLEGSDKEYLEQAMVTAADKDGAVIFEAPIEDGGRFYHTMTHAQWKSCVEGSLDIRSAHWPKERVNTRDLVKLMKYLLGKTSYNRLEEYIASDLDASGSLDLRDILLLRDWILKRPVSDLKEHFWTFVTRPCFEERNGQDAAEAFKTYDSHRCMMDMFDQRRETKVLPLLKGDVTGADLRSGQTIHVEISSILHDQKGPYVNLKVAGQSRCLDAFQMEVDMPEGQFDAKEIAGVDIATNTIDPGHYSLVGWRDFDAPETEAGGFEWKFYPKDLKGFEQWRSHPDEALIDGMAVSCSDEVYRLVWRATQKEAPVMDQPWPNPFHTGMTVPLEGFDPDGAPVHLRVYSISGRRMYSDDLYPDGEQKAVRLQDMGHWSNGIYVVQLTQGAEVRTYRMLKI